jgi:hypothetical protein
MRYFAPFIVLNPRAIDRPEAQGLGLPSRSALLNVSTTGESKSTAHPAEELASGFAFRE